MKRLIAFILAVMATVTLTACSSAKAKDNHSDNNSSSSTPANNTPSSDNSAGSEPAESAYNDAVSILEDAWDAYPEDDKFPIFGGSTDVAMDYDGKPGPFTLTMTDEMANNLKVPGNIMPQVKSAASMIHMMNANTFTSAAFEVDGDIEAFSTALVDCVNSTQWVCGFPETVITVKVGKYLIMAFGNGKVIENFKTAATTAVKGSSLVHEGPISFGGGGIGDGIGVGIPVL